jgi:hypothetical protein
LAAVAAAAAAVIAQFVAHGAGRYHGGPNRGIDTPVWGRRSACEGGWSCVQARSCSSPVAAGPINAQTWQMTGRVSTRRPRGGSGGQDGPVQAGESEVGQPMFWFLPPARTESSAGRVGRTAEQTSHRLAQPRNRSARGRRQGLSTRSGVYVQIVEVHQAAQLRRARCSGSRSEIVAVEHR